MGLLPLIDPSDGVLSRSIGIKGEHDSLGEIRQGLEVIFGQRGSTGCNRSWDARLKTANDVGVALTDHHLICSHDVGLCPIERIERSVLDVDRRFR